MTATVARSSLSPGLLVDGKYRVEAELGRGGMGAVYKVRHIALDQHLAMKVLTLDPVQAAPRFLREARAAARLQSAHVARVIDVGAAEGVGPYMVMELLEGMDLAQKLTSHGPLAVAEAVDAIVQTCDALAEAHALGIVHRDLKPANLFLAQRTDGDPCLKVLDFGISKVSSFAAEAAKLTETRSIMGSPHYMSPEQLRSSRDVDARADIWSLGVVLYELLTGRLPFDGVSVGAVFAEILEKPVPSMRATRPDVPLALEDAVACCLKRNPAERFSTVGELALAIADHGSGRTNAALQRASRFGARGALPSSPALHRPPASSASIGISAVSNIEVRPNSGNVARHSSRSAILATTAALLVVAGTLGGVAVLAPRFAPPRPLSSSTSVDAGLPVAAEPSPSLLPIQSTSSLPTTAASVEPRPPPTDGRPVASGRPRASATVASPKPTATTTRTATTAAPAPTAPPDLDRRR